MNVCGRGKGIHSIHFSFTFTQSALFPLTISGPSFVPLSPPDSNRGYAAQSQPYSFIFSTSRHSLRPSPCLSFLPSFNSPITPRIEIQNLLHPRFVLLSQIIIFHHTVYSSKGQTSKSVISYFIIDRDQDAPAQLQVTRKHLLIINRRFQPTANNFHRLSRRPPSASAPPVDPSDLCGFPVMFRVTHSGTTIPLCGAITCRPATSIRYDGYDIA